MAKFRIEKRGSHFFASVSTDGKSFRYILENGLVSPTDWLELPKVESRGAAENAIRIYKSLNKPPEPIVVLMEWEE